MVSKTEYTRRRFVEKLARSVGVTQSSILRRMAARQLSAKVGAKRPRMANHTTALMMPHQLIGGGAATVGWAVKFAAISANCALFGQ